MLIKLESITQKIIDSNVATSKTISDVQTGLKTGDVNRIKGHAGALQNVTRQLTPSSQIGGCASLPAGCWSRIIDVARR
jgi:hypothetical protein